MKTSLVKDTSVIAVPQAVLTPEYFVAHFPYFLSRYIAHGAPSRDTLKSYTKRISLFLRWCQEHSYLPLGVSDYEIREYREVLLQEGSKPATVHLSLAAVRAFFKAAEKLGFIKGNPAKDVEVPISSANDMLFHYFTPDKLKKISVAMDLEADPFRRARNHLLLYLMAVEGLRSVEVWRSCVEDINWETRAMLVRGKGGMARLEAIYPCEKTFSLLKAYLSLCPPKAEIKQQGNLTPLILSASNASRFSRLSRQSIRDVMDKALKTCGWKEKGISTHVLRHSCGTNLYKATKDLRVVQETLRHKDPKTTARYTHVQERLEHRVTEKITF